MTSRDFSTFQRLDFTTSHSNIGLDAKGNGVVVMQNYNTDIIDLIPINLATKPILESGGSYEGTNRVPLIRLFYSSDSPYGLNSSVHISCNTPGTASSQQPLRHIFGSKTGWTGRWCLFILIAIIPGFFIWQNFIIRLSKNPASIGRNTWFDH